MIENRILRKQLATIGTIFTFFGITVIVLKRILIEFGLIRLVPWSVSPGVACLVIASTSFALVIYLDKTYSVETPNQTN